MHSKSEDESGRYALIDREHDHDATKPLHSAGRRQASQESRITWWMNVAKIAVWVELANLAVLAVIVLAVTNRPSSVGAQTDMPTAYNVTKTFRVDKTELSMTANSTEAEEYWLSFTQGKNNGLVSVPMKWAEEQGLNSSGLPTAEGETVFQVDAFHQLHCLQRIRNDIITAPVLLQLNPNPTLEDAYFAHTLHCIDYLRQALMCQADTTLTSTGRDLEFDHSPPRQCRDFDALSDWVMARQWDFDLYIDVPPTGM